MGRFTSIVPWIGAAGAALATLVGVVLVVSRAPLKDPREPSMTADIEPARAPVAGVRAVIRTAEVAVERRMASLAFAVDRGQTLDARLPAGPFDGEFSVTFAPGPVRRAVLGAEIEGGTLVIERQGQVLASGEAGDAVRRVTTGTVFLPGRLNTFTYRFSRSSDRPARLRALWQPENATYAVELPSGGAAVVAGEAEAGYALFQRLNCVACHRSGDPALQAELAVNPGPYLGAVGARVRPDWVTRWILQPQIVKPGAGMPALYRNSAADAVEAEDLMHFLVSMGGPIDEAAGLPDLDLVDTGRVLYHQVGCMACHGPLDTPPNPSYTPLGTLARKTTAGRLAAFLRDPVAIRPGGRMPSQSLSELEAAAIASYLFRRDDPVPPRPLPLVVDPRRVARGREIFASRGCANCHALGDEHDRIESTLVGPSLEQIADGGFGGCLDDLPADGVPHFGLSAVQRDGITVFLETITRRRSPGPASERLASALDRFSCIACHSVHGIGGPGPAVARYFSTKGDIDLGDEGRLPPDLGHVGSRLDPQWLASVLTDHGVARPYMGVRMPQYGAANMADLPALFAGEAGVRGCGDHGPGPDPGDADAGRRLVGSGGFNCIQCHAIAGREATDVPGPDLAQMTERLRYSYFAGWLGDPKLLRPGTRMPSFFWGGRSGLTEMLDGDADRQIAAMWAYLSQGERLPLPDGLLGSGSFAMEVEETPVVFRTFMKDVGPRALACGFPEQVHCAFDADRCALRLVWVGRFLNAAGAWASRGGSETNPQQEAVWVSPDRPVFSTAEGACVGRFRGYRLDEQRRPVFRYDLAAGDAVIAVREQPVPWGTDDAPSLLRRFVLSGPAGASVLVDLAGHRLLEASPPSPGARDRFEITLDDTGSATFSVELTW